jgi:hypothetical protein
MHNYLLTLIAFLLFLLLIILYFLYKNLNNVKVQVAKNTSNINQLASALDIFATSHESDHLVGGRSVEHPVPTMPRVQNELDTIPEVPENFDDESTEVHQGESENRFELGDEDVESCSSDEDEANEEETEVDEVDLQNKVDEILDSIEESVEEQDTDNSVKEQDVKVISTTEKEVGKGKRRVPNKPAKNFEEGYVMTSENDGNDYQVFLTSNGQHRWKVIQQESVVEKSLANYMSLDSEEPKVEAEDEDEVDEVEEEENEVQNEVEAEQDEDNADEVEEEEDEAVEEEVNEVEEDDASLEIVDALSSDDEDEED